MTIKLNVPLLRKTVEWYLTNTDWVDHVTSGAYQHWMEQNYGSRETAAAGSAK